MGVKERFRRLLRGRSVHPAGRQPRRHGGGDRHTRGGGAGGRLVHGSISATAVGGEKMNEVKKSGLTGAFTGGIKAASGGIAAAIFFGYIASLISKPKLTKHAIAMTQLAMLYSPNRLVCTVYCFDLYSNLKSEPFSV